MGLRQSADRLKLELLVKSSLLQSLEFPVRLTMFSMSLVRGVDENYALGANVVTRILRDHVRRRLQGVR